MVRTKQTARKSTGGKVPPIIELYVLARKQYLAEFNDLEILTRLLVDNIGKLAYKDKEESFFYASKNEHDEFRKRAHEIDRLLVLARLQFTDMCASSKSSERKEEDRPSLDESARPTKRVKLQSSQDE